MTTIAALEKQFEEKIENGEMTLTDIWERTSSKTVDIPFVSTVNEIISKMNDAMEMICIMSNVKLPKAILHEIANLSKKGIRFYILVNQYYPEYEAFFTKNAIVRIDRDINGIMLLIDAKTGLTNKSGYLFTYNSFEIEKSALTPFIPFNGNQLKEAFHYFLWKFWDSMEEYRDGQILSSNYLRPPFDILPLLEPEDYYFNSKGHGYLKNRILTMIDSAVFSIHLSLSDFREYDAVFEKLNQKVSLGVQLYIYTDFKQDHLFVKRFELNENIHIYSNDRLNSYFIIVDSEKGLFLTGSLENSCEAGILLNHKDVQDFLSNLAYQNAEFWKYYPEIPLGKVKNEEIIREKYDRKAEKAPIERNRIVDQGIFEAGSLREYFESNFKPERKSESILTRQLIYRWKLMPTFRNQNFKQDPLYDYWDKEIKKIKGHINKVLEYAISTKKEKKDLLSTFIGRFLSNNNDKLINIINELEESMKNLETQKLSMERLEKLVSTVKNHSQHLLEEKMELTEKKQFHQEKQIWEEERKQYESVQLKLLKTLDELKQKKAELRSKDVEGQGEKQGEVNDLENKLLEIELEMEELVESHKEFFERYMVEKTIIEICKELDEKIKKFDKLKKNKKKNYYQKEVEPSVINKLAGLNVNPIYDEIMSICNISDSKARMSYLKKELATHPELRVNEQANKELIGRWEELENNKTGLQKQQQGVRSIKSELEEAFVKEEKALKKEIEKQENELLLTERRLEKLGKDFVFSPKIQETQLPFPINPSFSLPDEELPLVGTLYRNGKLRQLAIKDQSELDVGEREAVRLNAELVMEIQ